jgi:hypothetical protein
MTTRFSAEKGFIRMDVNCVGNDLSIQPHSKFPNMQNTAEIIGRSETMLATNYLRRNATHAPAVIMIFFRQRGWQVRVKD